MFEFVLENSQKIHYLNFLIQKTNKKKVIKAK